MLENKLKAGIIVRNTDNGVKQGRLIEQIVNSVHKYDLDILLGPEWLFQPKDKIYTKEEKEGIIEEIAYGTRDRDSLIIPGSIMWHDEIYFYNTSSLISEGKVIGEYHKYEDGGDVDNARDRRCGKKMYSELKAGMFKWGDYKIGIEICADRGSLGEYIAKNDEPLLDLYFLVACGMYLTKDNAYHLPIVEYGFGLNSDGFKPCSTVVQKLDKEGYKFVELEHRNTKERIDLYTLTIGRHYPKDPDDAMRDTLRKMNLCQEQPVLRFI